MSSPLLDFAEAVAAEAAVHTVANFRGDAVEGLGVIVRDSVMVAFGCTCHRPSDPPGVHIEDVLCPLHRQGFGQ